MPLPPIQTILTNALSEGAGFAAGIAVGPTLHPVVRFLANEAWSAYPDMPPDVLTLAAGVAQGQVDEAAARVWAKQTGYGDDQFTALIAIANTGPSMGEAFRAWRRGGLTEVEFETAMTRAAIEPQWFKALKGLKQNPLDPAQIATAVHRNIMRDASLIVREPPTTAGQVPQVPESPLDPATEAGWSGIEHERLRVLVGITGLPPGLIEMLHLLNMGKVTEADVQRAVAQSNLRNEYMDVVLALRRRLVTPHEYEEAALRGIISPAEADAGAALSGMEPQDAQLLYQVMGRPLVVHQITTGLARGGKFGGTYDDVPEPYRDAIRRSNIRPEYARLAYANRYSYPGAFVLRALAEAGDLGDTTAVENILLDIGWPPFLAAKVAPRWAPTGAAADPYVKKAQTQLWNTTHSSYKAEEIDDAAAVGSFALLEIPADAQAQILVLWQHERSLTRKALTAADVRKALQQGDINAATGVAWTRPEALSALAALGYDATNANDYLNIPYKG